MGGCLEIGRSDEQNGPGTGIAWSDNRDKMSRRKPLWRYLIPRNRRSVLYRPLPLWITLVFVALWILAVVILSSH